MRYKILIVILAMFLLNGLNNSRELNDLAIVSAIGIDKVDDKNYKVSAVVLNPQKQDSGSNSSSSSDKMTIYEGVDTTIQEAIRKMVLESPMKLYLAHMELLLISENVAKDDLVNVLDFFIRDNEGSNDFLFVIAKDVEPKIALQVKSPAEDIPSENIVKSIKVASKYMGTTTENESKDSIENLLEEGEEIVIPSIKVISPNSNDNKDEKGDDKKDKNIKDTNSNKKQNSEGSNDNSNSSSNSSENKSSNEVDEKVLIDTLAYFKNNKFQGYLTLEESAAHNILKNGFKGGVLEVVKEDRMVAEFVDCKSNMKPKYENGEYIVDINIKGTCNITEIGKNITDIDNTNIEHFENLIEEKIYTDVNNYLYNCLNVYDADLVGFGKLYREKLNKEYKKIKDTFYTDIYKNIKTNIKVDIQIPNDGGINKKW